MSRYPRAASFPVRPALIDGESLGSWCWRIFMANGHDLPSNVRAAARSVRKNQTAAYEYVLTELFGQEQLQDVKDLERDQLPTWPNGSTGPQWYEWSASIRVCPHCLEESGCHLAHWDMPLVGACARHRCTLLEQCSTCQKKLSWVSLTAGWTCVCGAKVTQAIAPPANAQALHLSQLLCSATDARLPPALSELRESPWGGAATYTQRDVYEILWWLTKMRRAIVDWRVYPLPKSWLTTRRIGARSKPGSWEIRMLMGMPLTIERQTRWALRWFFRKCADIFVDGNELIQKKNLASLLNELEPDQNPLAKQLLDALNATLAKEGMELTEQLVVVFNPRLPKLYRAEIVASLEGWWRVFSSTLQTLANEEILDACTPDTETQEDCEERCLDTSLTLLNALALLGISEMPPSELGMLRSRWAVPGELQGDSVTYEALNDYVFDLHAAEAGFIAAMAERALSRQATAQEAVA